MCKLNRWLERNSKVLGSWASLLQIIIFPLVLFGVAYGYLQFIDFFRKPDLTLEFSNPKALQFTVVNNGNTTAEKPSYGFGIFDLDSEPMKPVPIPWKEVSYLGANSRQGPNGLMGRYGKNGHRYFGFAGILCKNGDREKWYWIYFVHGSDDNAWVVELGESEPKIWNSAQLMNDPDRYIKTYFPEHRRIPIE